MTKIDQDDMLARSAPPEGATRRGIRRRFGAALLAATSAGLVALVVAGIYATLDRAAGTAVPGLILVTLMATMLASALAFLLVYVWLGRRERARADQ